jgi:hypothetical protein
LEVCYRTPRGWELANVPNLELGDEAKGFQNADSREAHLDWAERFYNFVEYYVHVQTLEHFKSGIYKAQIQKLSEIFEKIIAWYSNEQGSLKSEDLRERYGKLDFRAEDEDEESSGTEELDLVRLWKLGELARTGRVDKTAPLIVRSTKAADNYFERGGLTEVLERG